MAKLKNIRHMIRNQRHWNPFSDQYDRNKIKNDLAKYLEELKVDSHIELDPDDEHALSIIQHGPIFHAYFKQLYEFMKDAIERTKAHPEQIMKYLVAIGNSDTILLNKHMSEVLHRDFESLRLEEITGIQIKPSGGLLPINAIGAHEMQIDLLTNLLNYLRYFLQEKGLHDYYDAEQLESIASYLYTSSNIMFVVKESYDRIAWEDGKIIESHQSELHLTYKDELYPLLLKVGQHRIERNVLSANVESRILFPKNPQYQLMMNHMRKKARLQEVKVDNRGFISVRVSKTEEYPPNEDILDGLAAIVSFYPHINMEALKGLDRLAILDLLILYSSLLALTRELNIVLSKVIDNETYELKHLFIRIKKKELFNYLQSVTLYSKAQIESFLTIVESDFNDMERRIHLWSRPLIKTRDVYFLILASLQAPNYLQLIDEWLESAKFSLEQRGSALEKLIKEDLQRFMRGKGKYSIIPEKQKFYSGKKNYEEIDLIVSTDRMVLIAEIKNIKFPMEARDFHNGLKRLKEGAEQVKRKRDFLLRHSSIFDSELNGINEKEIYIAVICNYPHFTGMRINDVPVIDYMALQSYMNSGEINDKKAIFNDTGEFETEVINRQKLWNNIDEFYANFAEYLEKPVIVKNLLEMVVINKSRFTLEGASTQMFLQVAEMKKVRS